MLRNVRPSETYNQLVSALERVRDFLVRHKVAGRGTRRFSRDVARYKSPADVACDGRRDYRTGFFASMAAVLCCPVDNYKNDLQRYLIGPLVAFSGHSLFAPHMSAFGGKR